MQETLVEWLQNELANRNWSPADLTRKSGLSKSHISRILSGQGSPGPDALVSLARALDIPVDLLYRKAGLLPPETSGAPSDEELRWQHIFESATEEEQAELLERAEIELARLLERRKRKP